MYVEGEGRPDVRMIELPPDQWDSTHPISHCSFLVSFFDSASLALQPSLSNDPPVPPAAGVAEDDASREAAPRVLMLGI